MPMKVMLPQHVVLPPAPIVEKCLQDLDGPSNDDHSLTAQLKTCAHHGDIEKAEAMLATMLKERQTLSVEDYNYVIHACATARDVTRAEQHLRAMVTMGLLPNLISFNSVINACAMDGDAMRAELWLRSMVDHGVEPTEVTYGTMCKVLARKGLVREIQGVMDTIERKGLTLNEYFYASLISACGVAMPPNTQAAMRAFEDLVARRLRPQSVKKALERVVGQRQTAALFARVGSARRATPPAAPAGSSACAPALAAPTGSGTVGSARSGGSTRSGGSGGTGSLGSSPGGTPPRNFVPPPPGLHRPPWAAGAPGLVNSNENTHPGKPCTPPGLEAAPMVFGAARFGTAEPGKIRHLGPHSYNNGSSGARKGGGRGGRGIHIGPRERGAWSASQHDLRVGVANFNGDAIIPKAPMDHYRQKLVLSF